MHHRFWTQRHGPDGLRRKFDVFKPDDAMITDEHHLYDSADRLGADGEFIFVLRPETDEEAVAALLAYATLVKKRAPLLAEDIRRELHRIVVMQDQAGD